MCLLEREGQIPWRFAFTDHLFGRDGYSETDSKEMRGMQKEHDFLPGYPDAYNKAFVNDEFYHMC